MAQLTEVPESTLLDVTKNLLKTTSKSTAEISAATGASFAWLMGLKAGRVRNPGVNTVVAVYEYLSGKSLEV